MKYILACTLLLFGTGYALAGKTVITGSHPGGVTINNSNCGSGCDGVVNNGSIGGTGLRVSGTAARNVTNNGSIGGSPTGVVLSGSSTSFHNTGTVTGSSSSSSFSTAVGVQQLP